MVKTGFLKIARSKDIWLLSAIFALVTGSEDAAINWVPQLLGSHGISADFVAIVGATIWFGAISGNIFFPSLSDRMGLRKPVMLATIPVFAFSIYVMLASSDASLAIAAGFVLGFSSSYFYPMIITVASQLPEVSASLVASAMGLMISANGLGGFLFPPAGGYIRDLTGSFTDGFVLYIICALLSMPLIAFLRETGSKGKRETLAKKETQGETKIGPDEGRSDASP